MLLDFVFVLGNTGAVGVWTLKGHLKCEGWLFGVGGCSCTFPSLQASIHKEVVTLRELPVEKNILAALRTASELKQHGFEIFRGLMISKDVTVVLPVHIVHMPEMHIGHCVRAQVWTEIEIFPGHVPLWPTIQLFPKCHRRWKRWTKIFSLVTSCGLFRQEEGGKMGEFMPADKHREKIRPISGNLGFSILLGQQIYYHRVHSEERPKQHHRFVVMPVFCLT